MTLRRVTTRARVAVAALVLCLVGVGGSPVGGAAAATGETCHGQAATLVGTPGSTVQGTDGADVVVTNGAANTSTGAGDDLVCVTGGGGLDTAFVSVDDGADVVDTVASQAGAARVFLGLGDDTYTGGAGADLVDADDPWDSPPGEGADVVTTGGGNDMVATGGSPSSIDHDTIDLGPGRDDAWLQGPVDPAMPIQGGPGVDRIELDRSTLRHALVIDNATGQATDAGVPVLTWTSLEEFDLTPIGPHAPPSFIGGAGPERLVSQVALTSVDLGAGDDTVNLEPSGALVDHATYAGGAGHDAFVLYAGAGDMARRVSLDIPAGRLFFRRGDPAGVHAGIRGFERDRFSARRLDVVGSAHADHLQWLGCRGFVDGGGGRDLIEAMSDSDAGCGYLGQDAQLVVRGGGGNDRLLGSYFPDVLLGGPGDDVANGRGNRDRCVAETTFRCERVTRSRSLTR
jgi:Ca2+-binding RTX toxin-like protein